MKTYAGFFRRTAAARFLYGAVTNYRLSPRITSLPNRLGGAFDVDPVEGEAPLTVTAELIATPISPLNGRASWPSTIPNQGGIAVLGTAYPRKSGTVGTTAAQTVAFDDEAPLPVDWDDTEDFTFADAGEYPVTFSVSDALARTPGDTVIAVTAT